MLDAMLADEKFAAEVRSSIGLNDDEIKKLRAALAQSISNLDEGDTTERSTRASIKTASDEVEKVLGRDRAQKLLSLVQQRWTSDGVATTGVPTDTRVIVNIPAFRMDMFDKGKLVKTFKIGIGYPEFPLPTGIRKAKQIIVNPTWTPPDEPWVKGKVRPFEKVDAGSKLNPLGVIKIPIGSPSLIHGGKSAARLGTFASHGCVGLTNQQVEEFAVRLSELAGKPITLQEIKAFEKAKTETKTIDLPEDITVELRYETIVVEDGTLKIFRDVYERGTNTEENLQRVLQANGTSLEALEEASRQQALAALREMGTDATGRPVDSATANANPSNTNSAKVTKSIKGKKEVAIRLPSLAGKGYPAAVGSGS